jgi:hypothetical protein
MANGRTYSVVFAGVAVTAAQDVFEITPADDRPVKIAGLFISQTSDVGDAQDEVLRYSIIRGYTTSGSGGTAPTPQILDPRDSAAGFTAEVNNTTVANTGTAVVLHEDAFNVRAGLALWFPPECQPAADQANTTIVVRLNNAPADSLTMNGTLYVVER